VYKRFHYVVFIFFTEESSSKSKGRV